MFLFQNALIISYISVCLPFSGTSQRLNGKVSGVLNNIQFSNLDMHSFVVTKDGRAYTAISRVPVEIGPHMMTLNTIGGVIGWLFALPISRGALNGYSFTGIFFTLYRCTCFRFHQSFFKFRNGMMITHV